MKQKAICVLGMHRSGTSLITKALDILGVYLGREDRITPPVQNSNPEGFWEHMDVVDIHEKILQTLGRSWESSEPLFVEWWKDERIKSYKKELMKFIKSEFANSPVWGWKDPRTCIMMPIWEEVLNALDIDIHFILVVRNPLDVANSLNKRDNMSILQGMRLWYFYMVNALEYTKDQKRLCVSYDNFVDNPVQNAERVCSFINIASNAIIYENVQGIVKSGLRHSKTSMEVLKEKAPEKVFELYFALTKCLKENNLSHQQFFSFSKSEYDKFADLMEVGKKDKESLAYISSLFYDTGLGYNEKNCVKSILTISNDNTYTLEFKIDNANNNIKDIRFDPIEGYFCRCMVKNVEMDAIYTGIKSKNILRERDSWDEFVTFDPYYEFEGNFNKLTWIKIEGKIEIFDNSDLTDMFNDVLSDNRELVERLFNENNKVKILEHEVSNQKHEYGKLNSDRDHLGNEYMKLNADRDLLLNEYTKIMADFEEALKQYDFMRIERDACKKKLLLIENSLVWKLAKSYRSMLRYLYDKVRK